MQTQATGLHRFVHPLVRKKVFDRKQYGTFLAQAAAHSRVNSGILVIDTLNGRQRQGYPARNEFFGADLVRIEQTVNAAAVRVSHHDDVMHLKMLDAVLDGGDHRIVFAGGYLLLFLFYVPSRNRFVVRKDILATVFVIGIAAGVILLNPRLFLAKFQGVMQNSDALISQFNLNFGGSAYLVNLQASSVQQVILMSPLKALYFLFSPVPFDWRNIMDAIAYPLIIQGSNHIVKTIIKIPSC